MLTAALNKKIKRFVPLREDEVTSSVFGEMRFLPASDVWEVFKKILSEYSLEKTSWPTTVPDRTVFSFWKRNTVEPDLIIDFFLENKLIAFLLIEVKWDNGLKPKCELVRQWQDRKNKEVPCLHLYLVKKKWGGYEEVARSLDIARQKEDCNQSNCCETGNFKRKEVCGIDKKTVSDWKNRLFCISWRDFLDLRELSSAGQEWANGLSAFLNKQRMESFKGFSWINQYSSSIRDLKSLNFFLPREFFEFLDGENNFNIIEEDICFFERN